MGASLDRFVPGDFAGSVSVVVRTDTDWTFQTKLRVSDTGGPIHMFGWSVAIEGNTLIASAPGSAVAWG